MDLREAIKAKGYNQREFAAAVGVTEGRVSQWISARRVSIEKCQAVAALIGVPLHELRPDIYPAPTDPARPFLSATALPAPNTGSKPGSPATAAGAGTDAPAREKATVPGTEAA